MSSLFIFDFDGTLVNLNINYNTFKHKHNIHTSIYDWWQQDPLKYEPLLEQLELDTIPNTTITSESNRNLYETQPIKIIISNNSSRCIREALKYHHISPPDVLWTRLQGWKPLAQFRDDYALLLESFYNITYIGDQESDRQFAQYQGFKFAKSIP